jgi:hypothetical protein
MRKIVLALGLSILLTGTALALNAGEVNVKGSLDFGSIDTIENWYNPGGISRKKVEDSQGLKYGFSVAAEYLYPVIGDIVQLGFGAQYLFERMQYRDLEIVPYDFTFRGNAYKKSSSVYDPIGFSWLPIYATIQINPLQNIPVYVKANLGYNALFNVSDSELPDSIDKEKINGIYWGTSFGYEFASGLILEFGYDVYLSQIKYSWDISGVDEFGHAYETHNTYKFKNYSKFSLTLGYKFKI